MKKRIIIGAIAVLAAVGLIFVFSGCDVFATVMSGESQPYGLVINAKSGGGVEQAKVILTPIAEQPPADATEEQTDQYEKDKKEMEEKKAENPEAFYAFTISDGKFDWYSEEKTVPMGEYRLTISASGYISIPKVVSINAVYPDLGEIPVLPYNETTDRYNLSFVLMWNDSFADVDGYLTFPDDVYTLTEPTTYDPYWEDYTLTGFSPNTDIGGDGNDPGTGEPREAIYWGNATTATGDQYSSTNGITYSSTFEIDTNADGTLDSWYTSLDVDDRNGAGPETITMRSLPIPYVTPGDYSVDYASGTNHKYLNDSYEYDFIGTMEYYVNAYSSATADATTPQIEADSYLSQVTEGYSADAVLYVFCGADLIGIYTIPTYTEIKTASVVRIDAFLSEEGGEYYEEMLIYPDIRLADEGIRGPVPVNSVVSARRPAR